MLLRVYPWPTRPAYHGPSVISRPNSHLTFTLVRHSDSEVLTGGTDHICTSGNDAQHPFQKCSFPEYAQVLLSHFIQASVQLSENPFHSLSPSFALLFLHNTSIYQTIWDVSAYVLFFDSPNNIKLHEAKGIICFNHCSFPRT